MRASLSRIFLMLTLLAGIIISACSALVAAPDLGTDDEFITTPTQAAILPTINAASRDYFVPTYYYENYIRFIENSRIEKELVIYATLSPQDLDFVIQAFNEHFPWVTVRIEQMDAYEVFNRFNAEAQSNTPTADILISPAVDMWQNIIRIGELDGYRTQEEFYIPIWSKMAPGIYGVAVDPLVIVYNTELVTEPPTSMKSLAERTVGNESAYLRKIAVLDATLAPTGYFGTWFWLDRQGQAGWDILTQIGRTAPRQVASPQELLAAVDKGDASLGYFVPLSAIAVNPGAYPNVGWSYISDGQPLQMYMAGITNSGTHSNTARLMLDYLLSQEGQLALGMNGLAPHRNDISGARLFSQQNTMRLHFNDIENAVSTNNLIYYYFDDRLTEPGQRDEFLINWSLAIGR